MATPSAPRRRSGRGSLSPSCQNTGASARRFTALLTDRAFASSHADTMTRAYLPSMWISLPADTTFNAGASDVGWTETSPGSGVYTLDLGDLAAVEPHDRARAELLVNRADVGAPLRAVSVVGSRSATTYGADVAGRMGAELAATGVSVVSGAAYGIDVAAHRGALAGGGPTVAVLACGVDRAYPSAHRPLLDHLDWDGAMTHRVGKLHEVGLYKLVRQADGALRRTETPLLAKFRDLMEGIKSLPFVGGFCYTQLTDVEQEENGLLTYDRQPKVQPEAVKQVLDEVFDGAASKRGLRDRIGLKKPAFLTREKADGKEPA